MVLRLTNSHDTGLQGILIFVVGGPMTILVTLTTFTARFQAYKVSTRELLLLMNDCTVISILWLHSTGLCRNDGMIVGGITIILGFDAIANNSCNRCVGHDIQEVCNAGFGEPKVFVLGSSRCKGCSALRTVHSSVRDHSSFSDWVRE